MDGIRIFQGMRRGVLPYLLLSSALLLVGAAPGYGQAATLVVSPSPAQVGQRVTLTLRVSPNLVTVCKEVTLDWGDGSRTSLGMIPPHTKTAQHVYTRAGRFSIRVVGKGCSSPNQTAADFVVRTQLVVQKPGGQLKSLVARPVPAQVMQPVTFTIQGSGTCGQVRLDFGDGHTATLGGPLPLTTTHTYERAGTFTASATGVQACSGSVQAEVAIQQPPGAVQMLQVQPVRIIVTRPVTFTVRGKGTCGALKLDFGDGQSATLRGRFPLTVTHAYARPGTYTARAAGVKSCTGSARSRLEVIPPPKPTLSAQPSPAQVGVPVTLSLDIHPVYQCASLRIDFGDGTRIDLGPTPPGTKTTTHVYRTDRTFTVTVQGKCQPLPISMQLKLPVSRVIGALAIQRLELRFSDGKTRPTVPLGFPDLTAYADLSYSGSGLLQAEWVVDGRVIGNVNRFLTAGYRVTLESPHLPTLTPGLHRVTLRIHPDIPAPSAPSVTYMVTASRAPIPQPQLPNRQPVPGTDVALPDFIRNLPVQPELRVALARGEMSLYRLLRFAPDGSMTHLGVVQALILTRRPSADDREVTIGGRPWRMSRDGPVWTVWAPLTGAEGQQIGTIVYAPEFAINFDPDGDGVVDVVMRWNQEEEYWMVREIEAAWRFLEELLRGREVCGAMRAGFGRDGGMGRKETPPGPEDLGLPAAGRSKNRGIQLCGRGRGPGLAGFGGSSSPFEQAKARCRELLKNSCSGRIQDPRGMAGIEPEDIVRFVFGVAQRLASRPYIGGLAAFGAGIATTAIGWFLEKEGREYQESIYVNEADKDLHNWERLMRRWGYNSVQEAMEAGYKPNMSVAYRACAAGSGSQVCGGPYKFGERKESTEEERRQRAREFRQRIRRLREQGQRPMPGREGASGRSVQDVACDACKATLEYFDQVEGAVEEAKKRCQNPASQPAPTYQEKVQGPSPRPQPRKSSRRLGSEVECRAYGKRRPERASMEDVLRAAGCQPGPTEDPGPEGGTQPRRRRPCRNGVGSFWDLGQQRGALWTGLGQIMGINLCPEETCDPADIP